MNHRQPVLIRVACVLLLWGTAGSGRLAADWPTYRHDARRSGVTSSTLPVERLEERWRWRASQPPFPAWPDAARWDAYAMLEGLRSMRSYDSVAHPVGSDGQVFLASNTDDTVRCFGAETGEIEWTFTADAPIRISPVLWKDLLLFGSDDGAAYAIDRRTGGLVWRTVVCPDAGTFFNDGRLCSFQPIRTGAVIDPQRDVAIVGTGIFPWRRSTLAGLSLADGSIVWQRDLGSGWTLEGAPLLSNHHLIFPQGRAAPQLFDRRDGEPLGPLDGGGGSFALATEDGEIFHGPGNKAGWLTQSRVAAHPGDAAERLATFQQATAAVVQGEQAFVLSPGRLAAFDRPTGTLLWVRPCPSSHELVLAGATLVVGGDGEVRAHSSDNGKRLWRADVDGRAMGLAVVRGKLYVSTDRGVLHCFADSGRRVTATIDLVDAKAGQAELPDGEQLHSPVAPEPVEDGTLIDRWVFQQDQLESYPIDAARGVTGIRVRSLAPGGRPAPLARSIRWEPVGNRETLVLDGLTDSEIAADIKDIRRPETALSVTAWVRLDEPLAWGGLLGMMQDNGDDERGWLLGFRGSRFGFAVNGENGPDELTWVLAEEAQTHLGSWHHVAGTYDGKAIRLYVDGELAGQSDRQRGAIRYPAEAFYQLAAYRDRDEHFLMQGRLHEVRLYERALTAEEIGTQFESLADDLVAQVPDASPEEAAMRELVRLAPAPESGPEIRFVRPGVAEVRWTTDEPQPTRLSVVDGEASLEVADPKQSKQHHVARLTGIRRGATIRFRLHWTEGGQPRESRVYECDRHFDYTRQPPPPLELDDETRRLAEQVLANRQAGEPRGIAVVWSAADRGRLAAALATSGGLDVITYEPDPSVRRRARQRLLQAGIYGRSVCVLAAGRPAEIDIPAGTIDLVVLPREAERNGWDAEDLRRLRGLVQPRGVMVTWRDEPREGAEAAADQPGRWRVFRQPEPDGTAPWTHLYGTPDNTAYVGETLSGARFREDLRVAWAGRPGPRYQSDRGNRKPSPLAESGRLYLQGFQRVISLDAYNGTILWSVELPDVVRFNVPRDCANWCVDDQQVFVASRDDCLVLDGATGETVTRHAVPDPQGKGLHWGYVARQADMLLGTGVAADAPFREFWGPENWYDATTGESAKKVCGDLLFGLDAETGELRWQRRGRLIVHPTITVADETVYFLESRDPELIAGEARRLGGPRFWHSLHLVALDLKTGQVRWEMPAQPVPGESAVYMVCAAGTLLLQTSQAGTFSLYAFDAETGRQRWRGQYAWETDHHGKHLSRPAVVEGKVYLRPLTLDLDDGQVLAEEFPSGHQCGTYTASRDALFLRAGSLAMWDRISGAAGRWDRARPDCWISTIPAEGMLLSPEGGGGCSCGGWIETSMGFAPRYREQLLSAEANTR